MHALIVLLFAVVVLVLLLELVTLLGLDARATKIIRLIIIVLFLLWLVRWFFFGEVDLALRQQRGELTGAQAQAVHPRRHALHLAAHARHPLTQVIEPYRAGGPHPR
jgi:hypothetical protein